MLGRLARARSPRCLATRDDLIGEGMLEVVRRVGEFDRASSPWPAWVWMVASGRMSKALRYEARRVMARVDADMPLPDSPLPGPFTIAALQVCTDKEAETLVWSLGLDGAAPRGDCDVAWVLGIDRRNVAGRCDRALKRLRRHLSDGDAA